jgi:Ni/Fe-hydrogenase subunit HybB-like protein
MVLTLMLVVRKIFHLEEYITLAHIESMNKVIILTGSIVGVAYITELFTAWYSQNQYEQYAFINRSMGPYWWSYWGMMTCNVISPQLFWIRKLRRSVVFTFFMSVVINIGMWFERFVIIVTSLHRDFIVSSWSYYTPTVVEIFIYLGTIGFFMTLFLVFAKVAPVIALAEVKSILKTAGDQYIGAGAKHGHHEEETSKPGHYETLIKPQ